MELSARIGPFDVKHFRSANMTISVHDALYNDTMFRKRVRMSHEKALSVLYSAQPKRTSGIENSLIKKGKELLLKKSQLQQDYRWKEMNNLREKPKINPISEKIAKRKQKILDIEIEELNKQQDQSPFKQNFLRKHRSTLSSPLKTTRCTHQQDKASKPLCSTVSLRQSKVYKELFNRRKTSSQVTLK